MVKQTNKMMKFDNKVSDLFLNGGQVVQSFKYTAKTYLVRMPLGNYAEFGEMKFEFVWIQNYLKDDTLHIGGYINNTLRGAKKDAEREHQEYCHDIYRARIRSEKKK